MQRATHWRTRAVRILTIYALAVLTALALAARLFDLQIVQGPKLESAALAERLRTVPLTPLRGAIWSADGTLLAEEVPAHAVFAVPPEIKDRRGTAAALGRVLAVPPATLLPALSRKTWFQLLPVPPLTPAQTAAVENLGLPGIGVEPYDYRLYPEGETAANLLGFVSTSGTGLAGVEAAYQSALGGRTGQAAMAVDAAGNPLPSLGEVVQPATPGDGLELTLNLPIQAFAESALKAAVRKARARGGRIVVLDPETGGILALAVWPTFNPNDWQRTPLADTADTAVQDDYPPGSTLKPLTLAAALLDGVVTPASTWDDTGSIVIDGRRIHDWNMVGFGHVDTPTALADSSDVVFMDIGLRLGKARFYEDVLHRFHLDRPTGVDLPGEAGPLLPAQSGATKLDVAEMAIGQTLALSPIALAAAVAALADGGVWHEPHVAAALVTPSGRREALPVTSARILPADVAREVAQMMVGVVDRGTGTLARIPGYVVAGKTGTASLPVNGHYQHNYMSSFIGFAPASHPRLLVLVQLNDPQGSYYGGDIAAPVFRQVMQAALTVLHVPPDNPSAWAPPPVRVPALVGDSLPAAEATAAAQGLAVTATGNGARVRSQFPLPGDRVPVGTAIAVDLGRVAAGHVPSVLGLTVRQAARVLLDAGYAIRPLGTGTAYEEIPTPGTPLPRGATVTVRFRPSATRAGP
jgi:stage V sporulation protein D (sporulation-specific penicillin-binding protein)